MAMMDSLAEFGRGVRRALKIRKKISDKRKKKAGKKVKKTNQKVSIGMAIKAKEDHKKKLEKANQVVKTKK